jgi:hypothetical protein
MIGLVSGTDPSSAAAPAPRTVQIGLYLTNQHPVGSDMVEALRGQMSLLHHARDHGWDSVWGAQHFLPTMAMTQPVPFLARLAAEAGEMRVSSRRCRQPGVSWR